MGGSGGSTRTIQGFPIPNPREAAVVGRNEANVARRATYAQLYNYLREGSFDSFRRGNPRPVHGRFEPLERRPPRPPTRFQVPSGNIWSF